MKIQQVGLPSPEISLSPRQKGGSRSRGRLRHRGSWLGPGTLGRELGSAPLAPGRLRLGLRGGPAAQWHGRLAQTPPWATRGAKVLHVLQMPVTEHALSLSLSLSEYRHPESMKKAGLKCSRPNQLLFLQINRIGQPLFYANDEEIELRPTQFCFSGAKL